MTSVVETQEQCAIRYKAVWTVLQMMNDRGFSSVGDDDISDIFDAVDNYQDYVNDNDDFATPDKLVEFVNKETREVVVLSFRWEERIDKKVLMKFLDIFKEKNVEHIIVVIKDGSLQSAIKRAIEKFEKNRKIEIFCYEELQYNLTKHVYVPHHKILTSDQKRELFDRYKIDESKLPLIYSTDPVARYYGAEPGNVIEITRRSETCGRYITYRLVIHP